MNNLRRGAPLIAAVILAARRIAACEGKSSPALESAIADSISHAERILARIDSQWPGSLFLHRFAREIIFVKIGSLVFLEQNAVSSRTAFLSPRRRFK